jgi:hypothetical protein
MTTTRPTNPDGPCTITCTLTDAADAAWFERLGFRLSGPSTYQILAALPAAEPFFAADPDSLGLRGRYAHLRDGAYLELVTPTGDGRPALTYGDFAARHGSGWMKLSIGAASLTGAFLRLGQAGRLGPLLPWTFWRRHFTDHEGRAGHHTTSLLSLRTDPELLVALTEQVDGVDPSLCEHPNTAVSLRSVTVLVDDATGEAAALGELVGAAPDGATIPFGGGATIELLDAPTGGWAAVATGGRRPFVLGPTLAVRDPQRLAQTLADAGLGCDDEGVITAGPGGCAVRFVAATIEGDR